jgi:hypothetical protein
MNGVIKPIRAQRNAAVKKTAMIGGFGHRPRSGLARQRVCCCDSLVDDPDLSLLRF